MLTRSSADADDLLQDTLVRAWRFRQGFKEGTNLKAWLFRILRNEFLAQLQRRKPTAHLSDIVGYEPAQAAEQEWSGIYSDMRRAVGQLSAANRDALLLVGACGFSYEEAAAICDCAVGTIKSRVNRARERLVELVGDDFGSTGHVPAPTPAPLRRWVEHA